MYIHHIRTWDSISLFRCRSAGSVWRFTAIDSETSEVWCDCPDFTMVRSKQGQQCKHVRAVIEKRA